MPSAQAGMPLETLTRPRAGGKAAAGLWPAFHCVLTPLGLGLAIATTSAAFFPDLEQHFQPTGPAEGHFPANQASECLRLNLTASAAIADHAHEEVAEAIVQPLDVRQHAYGRMVRTSESRFTVALSPNRGVVSLRHFGLSVVARFTS